MSARVYLDGRKARQPRLVGLPGRSAGGGRASIVVQPHPFGAYASLAVDLLHRFLGEAHAYSVRAVVHPVAVGVSQRLVAAIQHHP